MTTLTFVNANSIINNLELKSIQFQNSVIEPLMIRNVSSRISFIDPRKEIVPLRKMEIARDYKVSPYAKLSEKLSFFIL